MTKLAPEWVRTSDPVIRSPARYHWTTAPANKFIDVFPNITIAGNYPAFSKSAGKLLLHQINVKLHLNLSLKPYQLNTVIKCRRHLCSSVKGKHHHGNRKRTMEIILSMYTCMSKALREGRKPSAINRMKECISLLMLSKNFTSSAEGLKNVYIQADAIIECEKMVLFFRAVCVFTSTSHQISSLRDTGGIW